ncbi:MAG: mechanosensitive ion channel family protein [Luteolibacter sp.]
MISNSILRVLTAMTALVFVTGGVVAGAAVTPTETTSAAVPDDPLGRGTPRSSVEKFLATAHDGNYALAADYLDLSDLPADVRASQGPRLARQLWFVLERQVKTDFSALSISPLGDLTDGLPPNREQLTRLDWSGGYADVDLARVREPDGFELWKISSRSVGSIPMLYDRFRVRMAEYFVQETTVDSLLKTRVLGLSGVTWVSLAFALGFWAILAFVFFRLARWLIPRMRSSFARRLVTTIHVPVIALLVTGIVRALLPQRLVAGEITVLFRAQTMFIVVVVWILFRVVDFAAQQARARLLARDEDSGFSLIDLLRRIAKVVLVLMGSVLWLDNMGFSVTTILASLGVIGLAVGLASKNFIEDLIGAMTLHATGVVKRNESIRFGEQRGFVEDIGLRMTTIRTANRTLITLPNSAFAAMQIENFGRRDKIVFQCKLGVRCETTPNQLRYLLVELRNLLYAHPKVGSDEARVRFTGFGASSLDLDLFCFVGETDNAKYLAVVEELNLRIMDIVARAGTSFAYPSQMSYTEGNSGYDEALARKAEAEVRRWRGQEQFYRQHFSDEAVSEPAGKSKFPDPGATDEQPPSN